MCALEGPGVCYFKKKEELKQGSKGSPTSQKSLTLSSDDKWELETMKINAAILEKYKDYEQIQAASGDIVLLMGKAWGDGIYEEECCKHEDFSRGRKQELQAAVHKSPKMLPLQGRVLLSVDVIK
eukprot:1806611-Ditylum_brightwellii.AAC.1